MNIKWFRNISHCCKTCFPYLFLILILRLENLTSLLFTLIPVPRRHRRNTSSSADWHWILLSPPSSPDVPSGQSFSRQLVPELLKAILAIIILSFISDTLPFILPSPSTSPDVPSGQSFSRHLVPELLKSTLTMVWRLEDQVGTVMLHKFDSFN